MPHCLRWRHGQLNRETGPQPIYRFVEPALLLLLHMQPRHGYSLIEGLREVGFQDYPVDSSVIYRTLRQLEMMGLVTSDWDLDESAGPPRRVYHLTESGHQYLASWIASLRATDQVLHAFLEAYDKHMREGSGAYHS